MANELKRPEVPKRVVEALLALAGDGCGEYPGLRGLLCREDMVYGGNTAAVARVGFDKRLHREGVYERDMETHIEGAYPRAPEVVLNDGTPERSLVVAVDARLLEKLLAVVASVRDNSDEPQVLLLKISREDPEHAPLRLCTDCSGSVRPVRAALLPILMDDEDKHESGHKG